MSLPLLVRSRHSRFRWSADYYYSVVYSWAANWSRVFSVEENTTRITVLTISLVIAFFFTFFLNFQFPRSTSIHIEGKSRFKVCPHTSVHNGSSSQKTKTAYFKEIFVSLKGSLSYHQLFTLSPPSSFIYPLSHILQPSSIYIYIYIPSLPSFILYFPYHHKHFAYFYFLTL